MIETMSDHRITSLVYVSQARRRLTSYELDEIVVDASAHNCMRDVTGVLLYDDGTFLQYLEGPESGIESIYERIKRATRHTIVAELHHGYASRRYFHRWYMACRKATPGSIVELGAARWEHTLAKTLADVSPPDGVRTLTDFWEQAARAA